MLYSQQKLPKQVRTDWATDTVEVRDVLANRCRSATANDDARCADYECALADSFSSRAQSSCCRKCCWLATFAAALADEWQVAAVAAVGATLLPAFADAVTAAVS